MEIQLYDDAPLFTLPNQDNAEISLKDFRGSYVILYFYPKDKTPGCTMQACDFKNHSQVWKNLNAIILGISPDSIKLHQSFIQKESLDFTLLSDKEKTAIKLYGAWGKKKLYGKEYEGVIRSTFIIDPKGKIVAIWRNVKVKGHIQEIQKKLESLQK